MQGGNLWPGRALERQRSAAHDPCCTLVAGAHTPERPALHLRGSPRRSRVALSRVIVTLSGWVCPVIGSNARAATACKWPRWRSVVRTPEPRGERAMGAALTRPSGIASASARAPACGVLTILVPIGAGFGHGTRTHRLTGREASKCAVRPQSAAASRSPEQITWQATVVVVPNAAAQLPQRRGVLGRRRAGRPRWTAHRARSSVPRGRRRLPRCARRRERTSASTRACWPNARLPLTAGGHRCAGGWCARAAGDGGALARAAVPCVVC